jgi:hypothetical protein
METQLENQKYELVKYFPLAKVDERTHTAYGICTCEEPDKEGEVADYIGAKKSYQEWSKEASDSTTASGQGISLGNIRYMHKLIIAGKATKLHFDDDKKQIWLESTPAPPISREDPDIWPLLEGGFLRGYSHGGRYKSRVCDTCRKNIQGSFCEHCNKKVIVRYVPEIAEVSYVDNPALKAASFTLVRSNGSSELKKFSETPALEVIKALEILKGSGMSIEELIKADKCKCSCDKCKAGKCSGCTAETKCGKADEKKEETEADKVVRYLVSKDGDKHLPYTNEDGKPNHRLMGAAWAALHGGYRGNKYEGPDKQKAIKRLKQLYAREGMDTPSEKAERVDSLIKGMLEDAIQRRAFGCLNKGLYTTSRFASICEDLKYLWMEVEYEREFEGDESPVTDEIKDTLENLLDHFLTYVEEQVEEEREKLHVKMYSTSFTKVKEKEKEEEETEKADKCKCSCDKCKAGKCSSCTAETKCGKADKEADKARKDKEEEETDKSEKDKEEEKVLQPA